MNLTVLGKKSLLPFAVLLAFFPLLNPLGIFTDLRTTSFDTFQTLFPRPALEDDPVVIIDIDDASLNKIGQWPWSRDTLATLTDQTQLAAVTGFDIVFAEPDRTGSKQLQEIYAEDNDLVKQLENIVDHDELFAEAINNHGTVVLGLAPNNKKSTQASKIKFGLVVQGDDPKLFVQPYNGLQGNLPSLESVSSGLGSMSIGNDDSIVRTLPSFENIDGNLVPSLPLELVRVAIGASTYQIKSSNASSEEAFGENTGINNIKLGSLVMPTNPDGSFWIYPTESKNLTVIPAWQVLDGSIDPYFFEGKVAIVGTSASGLFDLRSNALEKNIPGVSIIAQFVQQIFSNTFLKRPDWLLGLEFLAGLIFSVVISLTIQRQGPIGGLVAFSLGNGSIVYGSYYFFINYQYLVDPISPMLICLLAYVIITFFNFLFTEIERSKVRNAFSQYLSPVMVEKLAQSSESLVLGGERKEMTVLFSDIRGFTAISEKYKDNPEGLTDLINQLLSTLSNEILKTEGTIDKYMGDCIMAFWNAPSEDPDHREKSIDAAFAMSKALEELNKDLKRYDEDRLSVGIGINTGECIVGNMGSDKRFDYTVLGDAVNLASRLEGQSGNYGMQIILGEESVQGLSKDKYSVCELDLIAVKGKTEPVTIYTVFNKEDSDYLNEGFLSEHQDFLRNYRSQNWLKAKEHIDKYRFSKTEFTLYYSLFLERIDELSKQTLPDDWSGVFIAKTK